MNLCRRFLSWFRSLSLIPKLAVAFVLAVATAIVGLLSIPFVFFLGMLLVAAIIYRLLQ